MLTDIKIEFKNRLALDELSKDEFGNKKDRNMLDVALNSSLQMSTFFAGALVTRHEIQVVKN
jgi:hypothetical protein